MKAPLVAEGYQGPDLAAGLVETSGCVSLLSSRIQVISQGSPRDRRVRWLDIRYASLLAANFKRNVLSRGPAGRDSLWHSTYLESARSGLWVELCAGGAP